MKNLVLKAIFTKYSSGDINPTIDGLSYEKLDPIFLSSDDTYRSIMRYLMQQGDVINFKSLEADQVKFKTWLNYFLIELRKELISEYLQELDNQGTRGILTSKAFEYSGNNDTRYDRNRQYRLHAV